MARRITDEERITSWFMGATPLDAKVIQEKINLIMRTRNIGDQPKPRAARVSKKTRTSGAVAEELLPA